MLLRGWRFLDSAKINTIVQTLADQLETNQQLIFLARTPVVDADDDEIVGKFKGQVFAADIIADDQKAVVYESGSLEFVTTSIPNLKLGARVGQGMINRLAKLKRGLGTAGDLRFFTDWENTVAENLVTGIRQRINSLICAMQMDALSYDRLGIKLTNASWGMPSDLKVTTAVGWNDATNGTPITDLQVLAKETAVDIHGETYNRATMSSRAFRFLTATDEFQNRVKGELRYNFGTNQLNTRDAGAMRQLLANIVDLEIEIYDGTFWERENNGAKTRNRVLPSNKVILSNSGDDNNRNVMDFANGVVTESIVQGLIGDGGGEQFGPISYYTGDQDLNPPDIRAWGVCRGFPRKHRETATATLTVGTFS